MADALANSDANLTCPLTGELFEDPVFLYQPADENTYSRKALLDFWKREGHRVDPKTLRQLPSVTQLIENADVATKVAAVRATIATASTQATQHGTSAELRRRQARDSPNDGHGGAGISRRHNCPSNASGTEGHNTSAKARTHLSNKREDGARSMLLAQLMIDMGLRGAIIVAVVVAMVGYGLSFMLSTVVSDTVQSSLVAETHDRSIIRDQLNLVVEEVENSLGESGVVSEAACASLWQIPHESLIGDEGERVLTRLQHAVDRLKESTDVAGAVFKCGMLLEALQRARLQRAPAFDQGTDIGSVVTTMEIHSDSSMVQARACRFLWSEANSAEGRSRVAEEGGVEHVVHALTSPMHESDAELHREAMGALGNLVLHPVARNQAVNAGAIGAIAGSMRSHKWTASVQQEAAWAVGNLASSGPSETEALVQAGAIPALVEMMQLHAEAPMVQSLGARALALMTDYTEHRGTIVFSTGRATPIPAPAKANENVAAPATVPQLSLADRVRLGVVHANGIPRILDAIGFHRRRQVHEEACAALARLLARDETRAQFADFGGGAALADSVREFRGIASVQKHAMAAAANAMVDGRNRESFARNGGLEATVAGVNALPGDASVAKAGCGVLRNMADGSNGRRVFDASDGLQAIVLWMVRHPQDMGVQLECSGALANSLYDQRTRAAVVTSNNGQPIVDALEAAMQAFPKVPFVHELACGALWNLGQDERLRYGMSSSIPNAAVARFPGDGRVQELCAALHDMLDEFSDNG